MSDLIDRQKAIDVVRRIMEDSELSRTVQTGLHILPSAQQHCTECPEYDTETKSCPKYCEVIRRTLEEAQEPTLDQIREYCKKRCLVLITAELYNKLTRTAQPDLQPTCNQLATDCISRKAAIDVVRKWFALVGLNGDICIDGIISLPSEEPEIIHCKDCKYYGRADKRRFYRGMDCLNKHIDTIVPDVDFCSKAERREDEQAQEHK